MGRLLFSLVEVLTSGPSMTALNQTFKSGSGVPSIARAFSYSTWEPSFIFSISRKGLSGRKNLVATCWPASLIRVGPRSVVKLTESHECTEFES